MTTDIPTIAAPSAALSRGSRAVQVKGRGGMIVLATVPLILSYVVFLIFPMLYALVMSFTNWNPASIRYPLRVVGLDNYRKILFENPLFWICLKNTAYYTLLNVPTGMVVALALAALVNALKHLRSLYRTLYYLPVLTSGVAAAIIWNWLYQPRYGLFNSILALLVSEFGLQIPMPRYLLDPKLAMPSIVAMGIWKGSGYTMVIFLAGLQGIPQSLYEAARVDGANRLQSFLRITVPLLRPTVMFVTLTGVIGSFQAFVQMFLMTTGGPGNTTRTIVYLLWDEAFVNSRFGYASAISFILFVIIMTLTLLQRRILRTEWSY
jgi:multiple sugar transport system permease protein